LFIKQWAYTCQPVLPLSRVRANLFAGSAIVLDQQVISFPESASLNGSESGGGHFPAGFFASSGPAIAEPTQRGKRKERTMNPLIQLKTPSSLFLMILVLACLAIPQSTQAVSPPPDGGYAGGNTAEGTNALLSLTTG